MRLRVAGACDERVAVIYDRIKPGYAKLRGEPALAYSLPPSA